MVDTIVIGAGVAGAVVAGQLARKKNEKVLLIDRRSHIGGNCYDEYDEYGILIHKYGPHIFHTNDETVYEYFSEYTDWILFGHEVKANVYGKLICVPFNLNTLHMVYEKEKADRIEKILIDEYGLNSRVPILELKKSENSEIREVAQYVYDNIFLKYTMKQWGKKPEEVDEGVTARVPVVISRDNRYFMDKYQGMPKLGYTKMFEKICGHKNIEVRLNTQFSDILKIEKDKVIFEGKEFNGKVVFTGMIDELLDYKYGRLPYRSLEFDFIHYDKDDYQGCSVVNYTVDEEYTRITEFKHLTKQENTNGTTIVKEYPREYNGENTPYYAINNDKNDECYNKYLNEAKKIKNLYLLGRLAEYKYYNIDVIAARALEFVKNTN